MKTCLVRPFQMLMCCFALLTFFAVNGCVKKEQEVPRLKEKISFCQGGHITLLTQTALEKGYFESEGIEAVIRKLGDGKTAMETFLAGDCEFGIMAEPPVAKQAFGRDDFIIVASLAHSSNFTRILARSDRGIHKGADLRGKQLAVKKGVTSHTFADLYLKKHGVQPKDVTFRFMEMKDMPGALMSGDIDAYASSDTYFLEGKRTLGDRAVVLGEPGLYLVNSYLVVKKDFLVRKPDIVKQTMKALAKAEAEIAARPADAGKLLARTWSVSEADAAILLQEESHTMALGQQQIDSLQMHARWMLDTGVVEKKPVPDFNRLVDIAPLAAVKAGGITPAAK